MTFVERLYGIFDDESVGWEAAKAIGDIPSTNVVLTKANRAEVKVGFLFGLSSICSRCGSVDPFCAKIRRCCPSTNPRICKGFDELVTLVPCRLHFFTNFTDQARQTASLVALTSLIKSIPRAVYVHEMPSVSIDYTYLSFISLTLFLAYPSSSPWP